MESDESEWGRSDAGGDGGKNTGETNERCNEEMN